MVFVCLLFEEGFGTLGVTGGDLASEVIELIILPRPNTIPSGVDRIAQSVPGQISRLPVFPYEVRNDLGECLCKIFDQPRHKLGGLLSLLSLGSSG